MDLQFLDLRSELKFQVQFIIRRLDQDRFVTEYNRGNTAHPMVSHKDKFFTLMILVYINPIVFDLISLKISPDTRTISTPPSAENSYFMLQAASLI
jgi:hypothetical protein